MRFSNLIKVASQIRLNGFSIEPVADTYIDVQKVDSKYLVDFDGWGLNFYSYDFDEIFSDLSFNIAKSWLEIVEENDVFLNETGKRIKRNLLNSFKKADHV